MKTEMDNCLKEWENVNDPPCHPSDKDWRPCGLCLKCEACGHPEDYHDGHAGANIYGCSHPLNDSTELCECDRFVRPAIYLRPFEEI